MSQTWEKIWLVGVQCMIKKNDKQVKLIMNELQSPIVCIIVWTEYRVCS